MSELPKTNQPDVLRFVAKVLESDGKTVLEIPENIRKKIQGMEKLEGTINGQPFRSPVLNVDGMCLLRVNAAMLGGSGASIGDEVELAVLGDEGEPVPPTDLAREFELSPEAVGVWGGLTVLGKRDWIRWIEDAKKPETRAKRIARTIEQLSEGKRRACCVDVNGFMMCRIAEDDLLREG